MCVCVCAGTEIISALIAIGGFNSSAILPGSLNLEPSRYIIFWFSKLPLLLPTIMKIEGKVSSFSLPFILKK